MFICLIVRRLAGDSSLAVVRAGKVYTVATATCTTACLALYCAIHRWCHWGCVLSGLRPTYGDVCLSMCDYTVQLIYKAGCCIEQGSHIGCRWAGSCYCGVVYRHGRSVFGVSRNALSIPLLVRSWSFALGTSWSYLPNSTILVDTEGRLPVERKSL